MIRRTPACVAVIVAVVALGFTGCDYRLPLTATPSRPIDEHFLGRWVEIRQPRAPKRMTIRRGTGDTYRISYDDGDGWRPIEAYHSDVAGLPLMTVQYASPTSDHPFVYAMFTLSDDERYLVVRRISPKIIADADDRDALIQSLISNKDNPDLLITEATFERQHWWQVR